MSYSEESRITFMVFSNIFSESENEIVYYSILRKDITKGERKNMGKIYKKIRLSPL